MLFPKGFMLGAATAAHQVEGNNVNSDCWAMEHMKYTTYAEPSLNAVDHYNRYEEDIKRMADVGMNAYRFSIEWARIEPKEREYDINEIKHYEDVINCCLRYGIEPIVTLHHFSSPKWFISKGGWEAETVPEDFSRYVSYVIEKLGYKLKYVCTINEANMGIQVAEVAKRYMDLIKANSAVTNADSSVQVGMNLEKMLENRKKASGELMEIFGVEKAECFTTPRTKRGDELIMEAHIAARDVIRQRAPHIKVGLTLSLHDIQSLPGGEKNAYKEWDEEFLHYLPAIQEDDFLGVQNYTRALYDEKGAVNVLENVELTQMEYEFYPEALEHVLRKVNEMFKKELIVTENGVAVSDDKRRIEFIRRAVTGVKACIKDNIPVKGYCYWSLLDNFEWQKGYSMTFGLIEVDRETQIRYPKESFYYLGSLMRGNQNE